MTVISMPLKDLPTLAEIEAQWAACEDHVRKERLWRQRGIRKSLGDGTHADMPLWVWKLGGAILAGQPNEAYSDFQTDLRKGLAPAAVAVINIVNGYAGYLPRPDITGATATPYGRRLSAKAVSNCSPAPRSTFPIN